MLFLLSMLGANAAAPISAFVSDFSDAFWQVPINMEERRFFCATTPLRGKRRYLAFTRAAQGSGNAPMLWARVAALIMRLTQALFSPHEVNLMCYVDDPLAALQGTDDQRRLSTALIILVWEALGFGLAYSKGQMDASVTWIGGTLTVEAEGVRAKVKQSIIDDICDDLNSLMKKNVITLVELHSLVGKLNHAAGLIILIRPFLEPFMGGGKVGFGSVLFQDRLI